MIEISNVSRRGFLQGVISAGAFVIAAGFCPEALWGETMGNGSRADAATLHADMFVGVDTDGTVYLVAHRSEMGTTSRTSLPMIVADELDADWKKVKIEQALGDGRYGSQNTDGSHSIREFYSTMREAGATTRLMLMEAAAQQWSVPVSECRTDLHKVVHEKSGRSAGYGELVRTASKLPVPPKSELHFKSKSELRYVGKGMPSFDLTELCTGKAGFGMDARVDGMVYASIARPPVFGGKVTSCDDTATLKVAGVRQTVSLDPFQPPPGFQPLGGVAVIADNTWAAMQGHRKLQIVWDHGVNENYNSDQFKKELQATVRRPGKPVRNEGDVEAVFAKGGKVIEADYYVPLLAHASMEPPVALADFRDGRVTVWAPTQDPQGAQETVAKALGIVKENVTCHVTLLGGGFGRKSKPDFIAEAAVLSKKVGRPVKVVWSREDDIRFDYYNAVAAMYMKAAVDATGKPTAWLQRSAFTPITSIFDVTAVYGAPRHMQQGWTDLPYDIPNLRAENGPAKPGTRIGWLRSVANIYHAFAVQCFTDELAHAAGRDPLDYLLELIGSSRVLNLKATNYPNYDASYDAYPVDTGRLRQVLEIAADQSGWKHRKLKKGTGWGIAVHRSFLTYVATVVQVDIKNNGEIRIPRVDTAVDAGLVVNPESTRSQFEGAAVFGTSIARSGEITLKNGAVEQSNFHDYPVARIAEAPIETHVHIVESDAPPAGVGEPGVPAFIPAFCNAIFSATGKRIRELPLSRNHLNS